MDTWSGKHRTADDVRFWTLWASSYNKGFNSIKDFPIIDKNIIKQHSNEILSDEYRAKTLHTKSTSGSTGTPLVVKQNADKRNRY